MEIRLAHPDLFEYILDIANSEDDKPELDNVLQKVKDCNFNFFDGKSDKDILEMLTSYKKHRGRRGKGGKKSPIFTSFHDRWNDDKEWMKILCDIESNLIRRIYNHCFREECTHKASSHEKSSRISYGLHFDHQKNKGQWQKLRSVSKFKNKYDIEGMMIEEMKCRIVCGYDHEMGQGTDGYEEKLSMRKTHRYQLSYQEERRTIKRILDYKEMKCLLIELKSRRAFSSTELYVSWKTLHVLFWKYARVDFSALVNCTEDEFDTDWKVRWRNVLGAYINLIKKLAVKCPGCGAEFTNLVGVQLSGVHMDHRGKKRMGISDAVGDRKCIDIILEELINGYCIPTCTFCHGEITAWENGREDKPDFM